MLRIDDGRGARYQRVHTATMPSPPPSHAPTHAPTARPTVTPQVFTQFNGQFVNDRALALAHRIGKMTTDGDKGVDLAFRLVYGRLPTADERRLSAAHVAKMTLHHRTQKPVPEKLPISVTREMVEELTGEKFRWDEELDVMKDYQPDLKPWDVGPETRGLAELCLVLLNSNEFMYVY